MKTVSTGKILVDKLIEECTENVEEVEPPKITSTELHSMKLHSTKNKNKHKYSSCIQFIVLFSIIFKINIGIVAYFVYYKHMNHN